MARKAQKWLINGKVFTKTDVLKTLAQITKDTSDFNVSYKEGDKDISVLFVRI